MEWQVLFGQRRWQLERVNALDPRLRGTNLRARQTFDPGVRASELAGCFVRAASGFRPQMKARTVRLDKREDGTDLVAFVDRSAGCGLRLDRGVSVNLPIADEE